jgi:hypothetical protein
VGALLTAWKTIGMMRKIFNCGGLGGAIFRGNALA